MTGAPDSTTPQAASASTEGARAATLHVPVLLDEVLEALAPHPGGRYLDGTVGLGGHSAAIMERIGPDGELCCLDRDTTALELARQRLAPWAGRVHFFHTRYADFEAALDQLGWDKVDGALIDIGVSSMQIDMADRGFSFHADGPLDMRMDRDGDEDPASKLVNRATADVLKDIILRYGEDPMAGRIARAIVDARATGPIETTAQLVAIVDRAYPAKWRATSRNHPATRTFQALRMAVNDELGQLERFLDRILDRLNPGGRLAVITFHSLEDRIVKHRLRDESQGCVCPRSVSRCECGHKARVDVLTRKPVTASEAELARNSRASSAKLRAAQRLAEGQAPRPRRRNKYAPEGRDTAEGSAS
ncbi:16S rRNA (cytosine(1402)-N(4))-methyltransferase RsmH [Nitratidesulfovibrio termitidis]|uniref:16S rRNA (cytosine(1402)-N(4))-methyltransferase RsmH n=1 Tax=Nitratidesulfovibrio termitidis TaxID=42252 RepID=UPI0003FD80CD|nr:16S rRNA (cytosine(1402)-N(4))-methyltransferase RsmH [Nitratidesulfovibrio termitidis]